MNRQANYNKLIKKMKKSHIGKKCQCLNCNRILNSPSEMVGNHLVRRQHAHELIDDPNNIRISCGCDHEIDNINGMHTTNRQRIDGIMKCYGPQAAAWAFREMRNMKKPIPACETCVSYIDNICDNADSKHYNKFMIIYAHCDEYRIVPF